MGIKRATRIRRLMPADAGQYRQLRLEALADSPASFGASLSAEQQRPLDWFAERLTQTQVLGLIGCQHQLVGCLGLAISALEKSRHIGMLWGMYITPSARGQQGAAALLQQMIALASSQVKILQLSVEADNQAAINLYLKAGFTEYGLEPQALKVGGRYLDSRLMWLKLATCPTAGLAIASHL